MQKILNFIIKFFIYALVFLVPLFWLPWSAEVFEFNKQYLIFSLVGLCFILWLLKMAFRKRIFFRRTPLDIWILVFGIIIILAAVFSIDSISSWLGFYGRFADSAIILLSLLGLYFLVVNNVKSLKTILRLFLISVFLVALVSYFSIFGVWSKIPNLPQLMTFKSFNPIAGSLEGLSIFLAAVVSLLVGMFLQGIRVFKSRGISLLITFILIVILVGLILLVNFSATWLVLGLTMLILLVIALWTRVFRERANLLILPIALIFISAFYWFNVPAKVELLNDLNFSQLNLPRELILDFPTAGKVVFEGLKQKPVLGSGPGTFLYDFARFKPVSFNEGSFWNVRFDKAPSQLMEMAGTVGILGLLSYLMVAGVFFLIIIVFFSRKKMAALSLDPTFRSEKSELGLPLVLAWLALFIAQFIYWQNTVLLFFFWLFTALIVFVWQEMQGEKAKKINFSFRKIPEVGLIFNVVLLILVFGLISLFYLGARFYLAEVKLSQGFENNEELIRNFEEAVNLNRYRANYRQSLSQIYLADAFIESNKPEEEMNVSLLQSLAAGSIQQARAATLLSPNLVSAWDNLGVIYRDSSNLVGGTIPFAIESFEKAKEMEPTNPVFYRQICRLNLISEEKDWDKTISYCQRAVELKPNYLDAHIQLALVYEQKGELETAVKQMEAILDKLKGVSFQRGSELAGAATEIYFQLGRLYFNLNQMDKAISMFEQAVIVTPNYANARYALALSYLNKNRNQDALTQLQLVDQLVPGNENVQALIEQLKF